MTMTTDPLFLRVPAGLVPEGSQINGSRPFAVQPMQNVHVEPAPAYSVDQMDEIAAEPLRPTGVIEGLYDDEIGRKRMETDFTRDKKYKIEEYEPVDFVELLNKENGPAQAFVAQEIFSRKF